MIYILSGDYDFRKQLRVLNRNQFTPPDTYNHPLLAKVPGHGKFDPRLYINFYFLSHLATFNFSSNYRGLTFPNIWRFSS